MVGTTATSRASSSPSYTLKASSKTSSTAAPSALSVSAAQHAVLAAAFLFQPRPEAAPRVLAATAAEAGMEEERVVAWSAAMRRRIGTSKFVPEVQEVELEEEVIPEERRRGCPLDYMATVEDDEDDEEEFEEIIDDTDEDIVVDLDVTEQEEVQKTVEPSENIEKTNEVLVEIAENC